MTQTELISRVATLKSHSGGQITGNIWLNLDGQHFPMVGWNDFVVVLMGWWATALLRLARGHSAREIVPFMDGPYAVEITMDLAGMLKFRALQRSEGWDKEVAVAVTSAVRFATALVSQGLEVLKACKECGWWSKDAEILESALEALSRESSSFLVE